ncbi:hypothetical protein Taro_029036 [Colocasia esculenta]|uniref:Uncharacterized protein n=1 Tax=Colocasia esculenta TaxID=4460 RepID=A0A843VHY9_COLES|nr:hypothetical protein [Colocasia esculenta]
MDMTTLTRMGLMRTLLRSDPISYLGIVVSRMDMTTLTRMGLMRTLFKSDPINYLGIVVS